MNHQYAINALSLVCQESRPLGGGGECAPLTVSGDVRAGLSWGNKNAGLWVHSDFGASIGTSTASDVCSPASDHGHGFRGSPIMFSPTPQGKWRTSHLQGCGVTTTTAGRVDAKARGLDRKGRVESCKDTRYCTIRRGACLFISFPPPCFLPLVYTLFSIPRFPRSAVVE